MKKQLWKLSVEIGIILTAGLLVALGVNLFRANGVPLNHTYIPSETVESGPSVNLPEIDLDTLMALMDARLVVLLDARTASVYRSGHIPGARSFPLGEKESAYPRFKEILESGHTLVTYCIDSGCLDSSFLAEWLLARGHGDVVVFREGMEGWRNAGNPVEIER